MAVGGRGQAGVKVLQTHHADVPALVVVGDGLHGRVRGGGVGHGGHALAQGGTADLVAVGPGAPAPRDVDDHVDLARLDEVDDGGDRVGSRAAEAAAPPDAASRRQCGPFLHAHCVLHHRLGVDAVEHQGAVRPLGGEDAEAQSAEHERHEHHRVLLGVGHGDEDGALARQPVAGGQGGFGEGLREAGADAHDLTGGFHLRPQSGVHAGEARERQHCFFDGHVLQVAPAGHPAGGDGFLASPAGPCREVSARR